MQGWLFINGAAFWQPERAEALLTSIPLVLFLFHKLTVLLDRLRKSLKTGKVRDPELAELAHCQNWKIIVGPTVFWSRKSKSAAAGLLRCCCDSRSYCVRRTVGYSYRPLSGIAVVTMSIHLLSVSN